MKKIITLLLITISLNLSATKYYLSPTGNDVTGNGSFANPWWTINKAWLAVAAGDTIYMRGGTYTWTTQSYLTGKHGTVGNLIKIWNYPSETPILTRHLTTYNVVNPIPRSGCYLSGNYIHVKGLEITGYFQFDGWVSSGWWANDCNNCIFESLNVHENGGGFYLQGNSTGNLLLNTDSWSNYDAYTGGGNADGINMAYITNPSSTNTVRGCRAWFNSDDGFDFSQNPGFVAVENSWAYKNGYLSDGITLSGGNAEGFKAGPPGDGAGGQPSHAGEYLRSYSNCVAAKNWSYGFSTNNSICIMHFLNNSSYFNGFGYFINYGNQPDIYRNNLSYANRILEVVINAAAISDHNAATGSNTNNWNSATISDSDFNSIDDTQLLLSRKPDGSLPDITFLHLATGSDLIDAGVNVGLPYNASAPDLGAFESGTGTNIPPVANAGTDYTITLPTNSLTLNGSGTDADGTISSYVWIQQSGPNTATQNGSITPSLTVTGLIVGTYVFGLTVTDNNGATHYDDATVVVNQAANIPPVSNAGINHTITLPTNSITLNGSGTDTDGTITSYVWIQQSGPNTATQNGSITPSLTVTGLIAGTYVFGLTVTDNNGATHYDDATVVVNPLTTDLNQIQSSNEFVLYPNPTTNELNISLNTISPTTLIIKDELGRAVKTIDVKNTTEVITIHTDDLANGIYFMSIINDDAIYKTQKFIKQ